MRGTFSPMSLQVAIVAVLWIALPRYSRGATIHYNRDIRPILSDRCFNCHGPDSASRKAGLRLDDPTSAFGPRKNSVERALVAGSPEKSVLVRRIFTSDPDDQMPPPGSHLTLTAGERELLRDWVAQGAIYEPHWSFIPPPKSVPVPGVENAQWPHNDIDRFVLARLEREHIQPSPDAAKSRWLRRVTYDLTGLPPSTVELEDFLQTASKEAYEKAVDRLLASPHYGGRMAVPWLDAARYADSYGYQSDLLSPTWPYRDWVVNAFNQNLPYDQFVTEQIAGDLLPNATREQRLATAFNRLHRQTNEGGSVEEEGRNEYVSDRLQTFSSVFLGLTFECARCHDHKFDPITQRDYYSLSAFFNSIDEWGLYNDTAHVPTPSILIPTEPEAGRLRATSRELEIAEEELKQAVANAEGTFSEWLRSGPRETTDQGLVGHFTLDLTEANGFVNSASLTNRSGPLLANALVPGHAGQAVGFTGDDELRFPNLVASIEAWNPYALAFWIYLPSSLSNGVIFHASNGSDTGYHGTEFFLENGRLRFVIKRFWPGNAIAVETKGEVPRERWTHLVANYDGSGRARGLEVYLDGGPAEVEILRDQLYKSPQNRETSFIFGARSRSPGLRGAKLDDLRVFNRSLSPIEVTELFDGHSLSDALLAGNAELLKPYFLAVISTNVADARQRRFTALQRYYAARNPLQETSVMQDMPSPRPAYVLTRGRYDAPKNETTRVPRSTPAFLPRFPESAPRNRLGLARWLTSPDHPLTARVAVNRTWQMLFGRGLVSTPENFGAQGATPSHPELLDWLARDFIASGWDTKLLVKKIVLSATYRQDSKLRADLRERDPDNLLLARGPSQRLSAEMIRDTALAASGLLEEKRGGPPVSPYMPGDLWRESNGMSPAYHQSVGGDLYRRSLYTVWKRTAPMPNMSAFDAPSRDVCILKRNPTGTPQQAFVLLNDPQFVEAARVLGANMLKKAGPGLEEKVCYGFRALTARDPEAEEVKLLVELWNEERGIFGQERDRANRLIAVGASQADSALPEADLAAATTVAQAILNMDATIWKR